MDKVKIKKYSDWWGDYDCSSNRNLPKLIEWVSKDSNEECDYSIYVDNYIIDEGFRNPSTDKIGWLLESPQINKSTIDYLVNNLEMVKEHYKYIFTCVDELLNLGAPFTYNISNATPWILPQNRAIHPKTKLVSMIASTKGWLPGHQNRLNWVDKLKDKVDLFGTGRPHQLNDKEDGLKDYMFSVSIENDDSDMYFTEKLTDNFVMGTVPVYLGSRKVIEKYFDSNGVIFLEDDPTLSTLTPEKYKSMIPSIKKNFEIAMNLGTSEDDIWINYLKKLR
jgi:hypothetical protein